MKGVIRDGYFAAMSGHDPTISDPIAVTEKQKHASHSQHMGHCFDYLRQGIMCAGDTTIEDSVVLPGRGDSTVEGWGITHQCKNWDALVDWTLKHRAPSDHEGVF